MLGVYDQTTISLKITLTGAAYDTTALSTLANQVPIIVYLSNDSVILTINPQDVSVSYSQVTMGALEIGRAHV